MTFDPSAWKNLQPTDGNLLVGSLGDDIGTVAKDHVKADAHRGLGQRTARYQAYYQTIGTGNL